MEYDDDIPNSNFVQKVKFRSFMGMAPSRRPRLGRWVSPESEFTGPIPHPKLDELAGYSMNLLDTC